MRGLGGRVGILRRATLGASVALLLAWAAPAAASALTHYASPTGTGDCSTAASACDLPTALMGGPDEVVLATGDYGSSGAPLPEFTIGTGLDVHGPPTGPLPHLFMGGSGITVDGQLRRAQVTGMGGYAVHVSDGTLDQALVESSTGYACFAFGGTISNSVCHSTAAFTGGLSANGSPGPGGTVTLRNDTMIGSGSAVAGVYVVVSNSITFNFVNVISRGPGAPGADVFASSTAAGVSLNFTNSNYATKNETGTATITDPGAGTNQTAAPLLDAAFRELAGSPTIDAGVTDPANGPFDLDGNARSDGASTDIGAFEFSAPPSAPPSPPTPPSVAPAPGPPPLSFSLGPRKVKMNMKDKGKLRFTCGAPAGQSCAVAGKLLSKVRGPRSAKKHKRRKIGTVRGWVPGGQTGKLLVRLNGKGKRLTRGRHKLKIRFSGTVSDSLGRTAPIASALKLKLKLKHS